MGLFEFLFASAVTSNNSNRRQDRSYYNNDSYDRGYEDGYDDCYVDHDCDYGCDCDCYDGDCDCDY